MQIFDIILLALIVIFLVLRLRGALGRRDGFDGSGQDNGLDRGASQRSKSSENDNVVALPGTRTKKSANDADEGEDESAADDLKFEGPLGVGIAAIREVDPSFSVKEFIDGATYAFEMILDAYATGDVKVLKPLLSPDVYTGFAGAIADRETRGQTLQETLVGISATELVEASLDGRDAQITIKFVSEQISALIDSEGKVIEGDPIKVMNATDFWTFSRSTKSRNPNWTLVGTGALS
ncbi:MAG: Tim44 domain-containing protein [Magnetovibrio sp.]|nr:Tim44 domain-containing protein [Magnetovibrio sp.]